MDQFAELRKQAIERRNKAITIARAEYRRTVEQIDQLRLNLGAGYQRPSRSKARPILELICDLIPKDQAFSVADMVKLLRDHEPEREFNVPTIRTYFPKLVDQGVIRKVSRNSVGHVLWAAAGAKVEVSPFGGMPVTEAAEHLLREYGPMRLVELVVEMQQRGFRPKTEPRRLMQSLRWAARRYPERFSVSGDGRWTVVATSGSTS